MPKFVQNIEKILPDFWQNGIRMGALFAPFRPREVNPENYDSKMKFWQQLIEAYCEHKGEAYFSVAELWDNLKYNQLKAECLETVLEHLNRNFVVRERYEFEQDPLNTWRMWAISCVFKRPFYWSVDVLKRVIGFKHPESWAQVEYVHIKILQKFCQCLLDELLEKHCGQVLLYTEFKNLACSSISNITKEGLDLCLLYLKCQRSIGVDKLYQGTDDETAVIKIPSTYVKEQVVMTTYGRLRRKPAADRRDTTLTVIDRLKILWKTENGKLQQQAKELQVLSDEVQRHMKENKRDIAKVHLRKKKMLELKFEKRAAVLHNIETLISSVEEAQNQGVIIDAYRTGSKALKDALNSSGLNYEKVDGIINEMHEAINEQAEVENLISNVDQDVDAQLEAELNEMLDKKDMKTPQKASQAQTYKTPVQIDDSELLKMLEELEVATADVEDLTNQLISA